jgi:hypothetical protein
MWKSKNPQFCEGNNIAHLSMIECASEKVYKFKKTVLYNDVS